MINKLVYGIDYSGEKEKESVSDFVEKTFMSPTCKCKTPMVEVLTSMDCYYECPGCGETIYLG
jgi:hypothetical protein